MTDTPLPESVKPEDQVTELTPQVEEKPSAEAVTEAEAQTSEPGTVTGKPGDAKPETRENARIRQLVDERKAEQAKRVEAENVAAFYRQQAEALQPKPAGTELDYPDQASFIVAKMKEATVQAQQDAARQSAQQAESMALAARERAYQSRVEEFKDRAPDYEQVAQNPNLMITPLMADAIKESESGAAVAYYLGKNPAEAARIAQMSPVGQATAIGRLEERVTMPQKRTTSAPPPPKTISGTPSPSAPNFEDMDYEAYKKARKAK